MVVTEENGVLEYNTVQAGRCLQTFYEELNLPYSEYRPPKCRHKSTRLYGLTFQNTMPTEPKISMKK